MLTELKLSNFRIFDDEVTVRFRPITVLIGHNSAGKSTIIKFLLMLQQSLGLGKPQFLTPEGDRVQLGIFSDLKNSRTKKRSLKFELTAASSVATPSFLLSRYIDMQNFDINTSNIKIHAKASADVSYNDRGQRGSANYSLTDELSGKTLMQRMNKVSDDTNFLDIGEGLFHELNSALSDQRKNLEFSDDVPDASLTGVRKSIAEVNEFLATLNKTLVRFSVEREFIDTLRYEIDSIRHLSPVREESNRVILAAPPPMTEVGPKGQYALPHLQRVKAQNDSDYQFIQDYLGSVAGISNIRFAKSSGYLSQCFAVSKVTKAEVLIADYGFGVSQCLPIFIQGAIMPPHTSLMVEQPEAQLHPTAQLEMGSFFCDLWKKRKVGSIIETHSDNILLRLRRLIAEGNLDAEDVSVAFFHHDEKKGPVVDNLNIKRDGSMGKHLPAEFFGENIEDVLKMGAASIRIRGQEAT